MKTIEITVPGSKSLTNRAIVMASLSDGLSKIGNISNSLDGQIMIKAIKKLGVKIKVTKNELQIIGNQGVFKEFNGSVDVGSAGTAARFLTSLITLVPGRVTIIKSKRMKMRPMKELDDALKKIRTGKVSIDGGVSSQFITALMMIAPVLNKGLVINITGRKISSSYIDMTIDLMKKFGIKVEKIKHNRFVIKKQLYRQANYVVESDLSGASYFFAAAAVTGKTIKVKNINPDSVQGDRLFPDLLEKMGCRVRKNVMERWVEVKGAKILRGITVNMENMPDTAQTLAVVAAFAKGKTKITGLSTLKIKETDRLIALKNELNKMKIKSEITDDSITIIGENPQKAVIEAYGDHRMVMAFAVAKLRVPELIIKNPEVVKKSFPEFWKKLSPISHPKGVQIFLIGFMGAGKSSVAKVLSNKLNFSFIEIDDLVLKKSGRSSISEIFSLDGEEHFRDLETEVIKEISGLDNVIISTGGGVMKERNRKYFKKGIIFFLKASFKTLEKRLEGDKIRPLFKDKIETKKLFNLRQKIYKKWANHTILTDNKSINQVIKNLLKYL